MEWLADTVRNITVILLCGAFLEMFLPTGDLARFIHLALGFLLLAAIFPKKQMDKA